MFVIRYVPLGLKAWFKSRGMDENVIELDWWQEVQHKDTQVMQTHMCSKLCYLMHAGAKMCIPMWAFYIETLDIPYH